MAYEKDPNEIGALWAKAGKKGEYMTGEIGGQKVVCFRGKGGTGDKLPAWRVLKSKPLEERDMRHGVAPVSDEDMPF